MMASGDSNVAPESAGATKVGKWNRTKRREQRNRPNTKMTKADRKVKYTALARERQAHKKHKNLICFNCRTKGHALENCPNTDRTKVAICYKCGSMEHTLGNCPKRKQVGSDDSLPFSTCFVCHEKGHLAYACPNNEHGIYINGGECKYCGSNQHRAADCPDHPKKKKGKIIEKSDIEEVDLSDLFEDEDTKISTANTKSQSSTNPQSEGDIVILPGKEAKKRRVVKF